MKKKLKGHHDYFTYRDQFTSYVTASEDNLWKEVGGLENMV